MYLSPLTRVPGVFPAARVTLPAVVGWRFTRVPGVFRQPESPSQRQRSSAGGLHVYPVYSGSLSHPPSGRRLAVYTNQPALVVYTANHLPTAPDGLPGRAGALYRRHGSIALETSGFPNAMNVVGLLLPCVTGGAV